MKPYYKAVRPDKTSHFDHTTEWRSGRIVRPDKVDPGGGVCGHGIHCSPTLRCAVLWQDGPSIYCEVEPVNIVAKSATKARCEAVRVLRWLSPDEQDEMAGFALWEVNHPVNPFAIKPKPIDLEPLLIDWAGVVGSMRWSPTLSVRTTLGGIYTSRLWSSVSSTVLSSVQHCVLSNMGDAVRLSLIDALYAYIGSLFYNIRHWYYTDIYDPWCSLRELWVSGYVPSFDGKTWRLRCGPDADVVLEI